MNNQELIKECRERLATCEEEIEFYDMEQMVLQLCNALENADNQIKYFQEIEKR